MLIEIPVAVAELFDKISILQIKLDLVKDPVRRNHVEVELDKLMALVRTHQLEGFLDEELYRTLREVNQQLWDVCEQRRHFEQAGRFDEEFIKQSRLEYKTNDRRASIKHKINERFDSAIVEVKSYSRLSHETN